MNPEPEQVRYGASNETENWLSMSEAARHTPYSAEYLSLLARKKKLASKKIGNSWYTTKFILDEYMKKQMLRTQVQNGELRHRLTRRRIL